MFRTIVAAVILIALPVGVAGCGRDAVEFPEPASEPRDGAFVSREGTVTFGSTDYRADFGTITVPENRSKSGSRHIHLPVIRVRSTSRTPTEPVFCLSGGPGQSNMGWLGSMWYLLPTHDIVAVGYRGVDGSTGLDCPEVSQAFSAGGDLLGDESMRAIARAWEASTLRLAGEGIDLDGYTMPEVIEDNEAVRKALGYSRINLKSGSYGTRVAYLYGLRHPTSIHRTAMIAVNPPGRFVWEPRETDAIVRRYSALWARDPVLSRKSPDLYATMRSVLTNMPRRWLFLSIDPARVRVVTAALLFDRGTAAMVFDAYVAAEQGDPSGLALMSVAYDWAVPSSMHWGDLYAKAVGADFDSTRNYCRDMEPPDLPLGSPMSKLLWGPLDYFRRPPRLLPQEYRQRQRSDVETLLLSGSLDVSTPAEYATNELLPCLRNGRQIVIAESGHQNLETLQPENARRILSGFFETGVPDESLRSYVPMDFNVRWGFPIMAKGALGILVLLGSAAVALVVWLVRRVW